MATGQVLVTVGTTKFDLFISTVCSAEVSRITQNKNVDSTRDNTKTTENIAKQRTQQRTLYVTEEDSTLSTCLCVLDSSSLSLVRGSWGISFKERLPHPHNFSIHEYTDRVETFNISRFYSGKLEHGTTWRGSKVLKRRGYKKLLLQIGNGNIPDTECIEGMDVEYFRFKDSIIQDIQDSSLVLSHAGAGSCLEVLGAKKPLVVVVNEMLMNNHQMELAKQLFTEEHAYYCTCSELKETLEHMNVHSLKHFPPGKPENFAHFLNDIFGFNDTFRIS